VTDETRAEMRRILGEITSGAFAEEWIAEAKAGYPRFTELREQDRKLQIEEVGARLRAMMPWTEEGKAQAARTRPKPAQPEREPARA
jgi:ketol-acid reductoisomerase